MKLRVLGAFGGEGLGHRPTAFLINDRTLIDAGTVSSALTVPEQLSIEHALISHSHLDHVAGLVYLSETLGFCETGAAVTVTGIDPVVSTLRWRDRKSTRLNSSHGYISYAVFCLKKKQKDAGRACAPNSE